MNIRTRQSQIRTIKSDDPRFRIWDDVVVSPRAGFEISTECPQGYMIVLHQCIDNGWLKPVAYMTERELLFGGLSCE